jgi:hypothetical protein
MRVWHTTGADGTHANPIVGRQITYDEAQIVS